MEEDIFREEASPPEKVEEERKEEGVVSPFSEREECFPNVRKGDKVGRREAQSRVKGATIWKWSLHVTSCISTPAHADNFPDCFLFWEDGSPPCDIPFREDIPLLSPGENRRHFLREVW